MQSQQVVYLIHFDVPYYHARHYLGTTNDLAHRLAQHAQGVRAGGARLMEVVTRAGIPWRVSATWVGGRELERQLKARCNGGRLCPICKANRLADRLFAKVSVVAESDVEDTSGLF